jgi:OTU domain-containing protein 5
VVVSTVSHANATHASAQNATASSTNTGLSSSKTNRKGLEVVRMAGDGNCLFRAVSLQVYGDPNWHSEVRARCMDYIARERDHFGSFVAGENEDFDSYVARKRQDGCFGNNTEIQAVAEIYNRALEVYKVVGVVTNPHKARANINPGSSNSNRNTNVSASSTTPRPDTQSCVLELASMNIFHGTYKDSYKDTSDPPIRLLYTNREHYDAVVDPYEATVGVGLGMPGLKAGSVEKDRIEQAKKLSLKEFGSFV